MDMMKNNSIPLIGNFRRACSGINKGIIYSILVMVSAIMMPSWAQAAQAVATVSKNIVAVNEVFQLTVAIDDSVSSNALDLSPLDKDFIYGTPNVSSNTSMINGVVTRNTQWRVAIAAKEIGDFTIPSFRIGATTTEPIVLTSMKSSTTSSKPLNQPAIRLDADLDKKQLYVGESFRYKVRLRIGEQMSQASLAPPSGDGLEVRQIGDDRQTETVLNGRRYVIIMRDYQITPTKAGSITLKGAEFNGSVIKGGRGFGSRLQVPVTQQPEDITLSVKGKPAGYQGLWIPTEDLQLEQNWQPAGAELKVGEPLTRIISLRIKNAEQSNMPNLTLPYPNSVKVYDEKPVYGNEGDYTVMTLKQVIIPRSEGKLSLPPLAVNWWNTQTDKQETSKIAGRELNVLPGDNTNNIVLPSVSNSVPVPQDQPTAPVEPQVITQVVTDAGFWPWLTALFAALWLFTTVLWLKARFSKQHVIVPGSGQKIVPPTPLTGMKQAAEAKEPIKVHTYYKQWAESNPEHPQQEALHQQVTAMMNAHFGKEPEQWDSKELINLLRSLKKNKPAKNKVISENQALAPLVPER
ncbi:BatD [Photobacterium marinum]|uniref:BatD n=1 Tax=Photobacterium marinum TaxID=1056511 RepID=L8J4S2_9GAMM|nr:BatD family protein [Photobacterium marinum]ELR63855.1 BatD [Photobacterium marinum]